MLAVLNPTYSLRVIIKDALPEPMNYQVGQQAGIGMAAALNSPANGRKWYNGMTGKTGCDDVVSAVRDALAKAGVQAEVSLDKFEHR